MKAPCKACGGRVPSGDEGRMSGLCQRCLNGPNPFSVPRPHFSDHEHEWVESAPGTAGGEPAAQCRCGLYRTGVLGVDGPGRNAFDVFRERYGTASTS